MPRGKLTEKERRFVDAYLGECRGNGTQAARVAGYSAKNGRHQASYLLTKPNIKAAIEEAQAERTDEAIATAHELDAKLTEIVRFPAMHPDVVIRATKELNAVKGRHLTRLADADGKPLSFVVVTNVPQPA